MQKLRFFVVSDSVGETGEMAVKAVVSQFRPDFEDVIIRRFPNVGDALQLEWIVEQAKKKDAIIIYTLAKRELRQALHTFTKKEAIPAIDLLGSMMDLVEQQAGQRSLEQPGIMHQLDEHYFEKIDAIEFAVKYDDGRDPRGLLLADIVLVGVSRTSKTPLSQYLAHKRYKVANVPIVPEVQPPEELFNIDPKKCFGLVISPQHLNNIRTERLKALGLGESATYAQPARINEEIAYFYQIVNRLGCEVIDVTNKAVEETANCIIDKYEANKPQ